MNRDFLGCLFKRSLKAKDLEQFSDGLSQEKRNMMLLLWQYYMLVPMGCPLLYLWPDKGFPFGDKSILEVQEKIWCHLLLHIIYGIGKVGYCDLTPAYVLKMVREKNYISKTVIVECTLNCKIGDLLHPLPVNDEMTNSDN